MGTADALPVLASSTAVGPFVAGCQWFTIRTNDPATAHHLDAVLGDLRGRQAPDGGTALTEFVVVRRGPAWLSHPWGVWRDGEPCETTLSDDYVVPYVLWEITRLVLEHTDGRVPMHAGAVSNHGRAVVLAGHSHAGKSTLCGWLVANGWGFLTDELALIEPRQAEPPVVHPFWRPIGVRRGGPLDPLIADPSLSPEVLVPASQLGTLSEPAPLAAFVMPTYAPGSAGTLTEVSPATALRMLSGHLPTRRTHGRAVFRAAVSLVSSVPTYALDVDALPQAAATLEQLVRGLP